MILPRFHKTFIFWVFVFFFFAGTLLSWLMLLESQMVLTVPRSATLLLAAKQES